MRWRIWRRVTAASRESRLGRSAVWPSRRPFEVLAGELLAAVEGIEEEAVVAAATDEEVPGEADPSHSRPTRWAISM